MHRGLDASSPELENMRFSNHQYMEKIFQCIQKKMGRTAINATSSVESYKTNVLTWRNVHGIVDESRRPCWASVLLEFGNLQEHRFENIENVFNITQKLIKEHSEVLLNVRSPDYSSPSWTRSALINDKAIKWVLGKACVNADSVLRVGRMEQEPGAAEERWKGQVEDLKK